MPLSAAGPEHLLWHALGVSSVPSQGRGRDPMRPREGTLTEEVGDPADDVASAAASQSCACSARKGSSSA